MPSNILSCLAAVALIGCTTGPSSGDGSAGLRVSFGVPGTRAVRGLTLTRLDVRIAEIVFDADTARRSFSVTDPVQTRVSVVDGTGDPDVVDVTLEPDCYASPYLGIELWDEGPDPALILEGTLDGVPIRFVFDSGEVFEAEAESLLVPEGTSRDVRFTLRPEAWLEGADPARLDLGSDGVAEISETSNAAVFDRVADALDETTDGRFEDGARCETTTPSTDTGT